MVIALAPITQKLPSLHGWHDREWFPALVGRVTILLAPEAPIPYPRWSMKSDAGHYCWVWIAGCALVGSVPCFQATKAVGPSQGHAVVTWHTGSTITCTSRVFTCSYKIREMINSSYYILHLKVFTDWCIFCCAINVINIYQIKDNMDSMEQSVRVMSPLRPSRTLICRDVSRDGSYKNYNTTIIFASI